MRFSLTRHCVKYIQILSFFGSVFSRIRTEYGPEKTPYLDNFHAVRISLTRILDYFLMRENKGQRKPVFRYTLRNIPYSFSQFPQNFHTN